MHRHCWHKVDGTDRKVPIRTRCRRPTKEDLFVRKDFSDGYMFSYVLTRFVEECCICNISRFKDRQEAISNVLVPPGTGPLSLPTWYKTTPGDLRELQKYGGKGCMAAQQKFLEIGDSVIVDEPKEDDLWNHSFAGHVIGFRTGFLESLVVVEDQEGNAFDVEPWKVKKDLEEDKTDGNNS